MVGLAMGVFVVVAFYKDSLRETIISECTNRLDELQNSALPLASTARQTKQDLQNTCSAGFNQSRIGFIVSLCISLLLNLCMSLLCAFCVIHSLLTALLQTAASSYTVTALSSLKSNSSKVTATPWARPTPRRMPRRATTRTPL